MHPKKTFYVWKCAHCEHRNKEVFNFHWEMNRSYTATWYCSGCGSDNFISIDFRVYPITEKRSEAYYARWR